MPDAAPRLVLGLLGGVASGKSAVARRLHEHGFLVLDADEAAREVVEEPAVLTALAECFGPDVVAPDGRLDRAALAERAFASGERTAALNAIVHPRVRERLRAGLEGADAATPIVLDVPLLMDSPCAARVTHWVFVDAPEALREARARERGWAAGERARREALQPALAAKRARADLVLENRGTLSDLRAQVDALVRRLRSTDP